MEGDLGRSVKLMDLSGYAPPPFKMHKEWTWWLCGAKNERQDEGTRRGEHASVFLHTRCGHTKFPYALFHSSIGPLSSVNIIYGFGLVCFPKFSNVRGLIPNKAKVFINPKYGRHRTEKDTVADLCSL